MKAFQYDGPKAGLQLQNIPIPEPGPGHVQLQVKAAGICHSDCHIVAGGSDSWLVKKPITLGHEVAGVITKLGPGVTQFAAGDRVAVSQICHPPEECDWNLSIGLGFDGGYAEYAVVPLSRLILVPNELSFAQAAVSTDALATSYHAIAVKAGAKPGMTVGVIGLGGLGMPGLSFAIIKGATVYGIDISNDRFEEAQRLGAQACFQSLDDAKHVSFDVIVDFAGTGSTTQAAMGAVKAGGKVVVVGVASKTISVSTDVLIMRTVTLVGSLGASAEDLAEVFKLLKGGSIDPLLVEVPYADIPASIDALAKGGAKGRLWADPSKAAN